MTEIHPIVIYALLGLVVALLVWLLARHQYRVPSVVLTRLDALEGGQEETRRAVSEEIARNREEAAKAASQQRQEQTKTVKELGDSVLRRMAENTSLQKQQAEGFTRRVDKLTETVEKKLDEARSTIEGKLTDIQQDNTKKLEEMRKTVDEKLHGALEKRLGESFKLVSERLEQVYKGLGEMQTLATGVGDLKRVMSNVRSRGIWGEMQLGNLLEQMLTPDQYATNVRTKPRGKYTVEFAVKFPGPDDAPDDIVWLPIDSKFPQEHFQRLLDAQDQADAVAVEDAAKELAVSVRTSAKEIARKYLQPPHTTDFGIMFLPTESLYAEVLRRPGLFEETQREYRVTVAGPTTLSAILNSFQMGFRTLAIQKRASEVWKVLGAVKTEFGKFGDAIEKVGKKLHEASSAVDQAKTRTRVMDRKLRSVEQLPAAQAHALLTSDEETQEEAKIEEPA